MTHICVSDLTSIGSDNGLSPGRRQAIIRTNAGILLIRPLGTNFSEFSVEILIFSFKKMRLKVWSAKRRPFCLGLNELSHMASDMFNLNLGDGLSPVLHQAITWTSAGLLSIGPLNNPQWNFKTISDVFVQENALENVVCRVGAILSQPHCVNAVISVSLGQQLWFLVHNGHWNSHNT